MRTAYLLAAALVLACLLALRPAGPTFPELVTRVEALEARVKALEGAAPPVPPNIDRAIRDGKIIVGMSVGQVTQSLRNHDAPQSVADVRKTEGKGSTVETWHIGPRSSGVPAYIHFRNGVVDRLDYAE